MQRGVDGTKRSTPSPSDGVYCRGYTLLIERSPCLLYGLSEDKSFNDDELILFKAQEVELSSFADFFSPDKSSTH